MIRDTLLLTDAQINAALSYIAENQQHVEAEYQEVLQTREEIYQYWEQHNRERLSAITLDSRKPEHSEIWAKLDRQKAQRQAKNIG